MILPDRVEFKKLAKELAKEKNIKPTHAHEVLAKSYGFKTYNSYLALINELDHDNELWDKFNDSIKELDHDNQLWDKFNALLPSDKSMVR